MTTRTHFQNIHYLFLLYDTGETKALSPVIRALLKDEPNSNIKILTLGKASQQQLPDDLKHLAINLLMLQSQLHTNITHGERHSQNKQRPLKQGDSKKIAVLFEANKVISGIPAKVQLEICAAFREKGAHIYYYIDALFYSEDNLQHLNFSDDDIIMVSSSNIKRKITLENTITANIYITGHPALNEWSEKSKQYDVKKLEAELNITKKPVIVYAGGYGVKAGKYEHSFREFVIGLQKSNYHAYLSIHPGARFPIETIVLNELEAQSQVTHLSNSIDDCTLKACLLADLVVSEASTVNPQARYALNKPAVFVNTDSHITDPILRDSPIFNSSDVFADYLTHHDWTITSATTTPQIPNQPVQNIQKLIQSDNL